MHKHVSSLQLLRFTCHFSSSIMNFSLHDPNPLVPRRSRRTAEDDGDPVADAGRHGTKQRRSRSILGHSRACSRERTLSGRTRSCKKGPDRTRPFSPRALGDADWLLFEAILGNTAPVRNALSRPVPQRRRGYKPPDRPGKHGRSYPARHHQENHFDGELTSNLYQNQT